MVMGNDREGGGEGEEGEERGRIVEVSFQLEDD
jgi:hypothetical protein